jgi:hypothetical protein
MVVDNTFSILAARWRICHSVIIAYENLINQIVEATVILHNFLRERIDTNGITEDSMSTQSVQLDIWKDVVDDNVLGNITRHCSPNYFQNATGIRYNFMEYFVSDDGRVSLLDSRILMQNRYFVIFCSKF